MTQTGTGTGFKFEAYTRRRAAGGAGAGAEGLRVTRASGRHCRWRGCGRTFPGTDRPASTSNCMRAPRAARAYMGTVFVGGCGRRRHGDQGDTNGIRKDSDFHRRQLRSDGGQVGQARAGRLLGGMVRPVPAPGADGGRAGDRLRRQGDGRQAERGREPEHGRRGSASAAFRRF